MRTTDKELDISLKYIQYTISFFIYNYQQLIILLNICFIRQFYFPVFSFFIIRFCKKKRKILSYLAEFYS